MDAERYTVLLVEDNGGDALFLRESLEDAFPGRFELRHVTRLGDALNLLTLKTYQLVLLDLGLPDSHGLETLMRTRAQAGATPIMVLTGLEEGAIAVDSLQSGAQAYMVKGHVDGISLSNSILQFVQGESREPTRARNGEDANVGVVARVYEGRVMIKIDGQGGIGQTVAFLGEIRDRPQLRVRLQTGTTEHVSLLLDLIQPIRLDNLLLDMKSVSDVCWSPDPALSYPALTVSLKGESSGPDLATGHRLLR